MRCISQDHAPLRPALGMCMESTVSAGLMLHRKTLHEHRPTFTLQGSLWSGLRTRFLCQGWRWKNISRQSGDRRETISGSVVPLVVLEGWKRGAGGSRSGSISCTFRPCGQLLSGGVRAVALYYCHVKLPATCGRSQILLEASWPDNSPRVGSQATPSRGANRVYDQRRLRYILGRWHNKR